MKAWQLCWLTAAIYFAPQIDSVVAVICGAVWAVCAGIWWLLERD